MREARVGKLESVTLDDLRAALNAGDQADIILQARFET
jgi:hypothetical protein